MSDASQNLHRLQASVEAEEESEGESSELRVLFRVEASVYEAWNALFLPLKVLSRKEEEEEGDSQQAY